MPSELELDDGWVDFQEIFAWSGIKLVNRGKRTSQTYSYVYLVGHIGRKKQGYFFRAIASSSDRIRDYWFQFLNVLLTRQSMVQWIKASILDG